MLLTAIIVWVIFGLLAYGQFLMNIGISVKFQKDVSKFMGNYTGYNWRESLLFILLFLTLLIGSILGGILWFAITQQVFKKVANHRLFVETISRKLFDHGWCI